jgi:outer membrane lipoprotein-sorting protein
VQVDPRGVSSGRFYLARPGKLRFEYDPPAPALVIADGKRVTVRDLKMKTDYRAKIGETPLRLLLKADVDLATDANITAVEHDGDQLAITAMETKGYGQGQITFIFKDPGLELQRWIVLDPTGAQTTVTLSGIENGPILEASLFELPRQASFESND